jgi:hypothetical protein
MAGANSMRGEALLREHTLRVNFNSWCVLEDETGCKVPELLKIMQTGLGFSEVRTWVRVFIDKPMTDTEAGDLIGEVGYEATLKALGKAVEGFFASPKKEKAENPQKAA